MTELTQALGKALTSPPNPPLSATHLSHSFTRVTTDSRKAGPGDLFVALKGDQFDGHDFIDKATQAGVTAILGLAKRKPASSTTPYFGVDNVEAAFRLIALHWRQRFDIPVVCVAGSVGKTTTKELLAAILRGRFESVLKTQGSQNGIVGIPMTLLDLRTEHQVAVIEVGIDEPGTMPGHIALVKPSAALLTAIGPEHLEKLINIETVAREEGTALIETAKLGGKIALNADDPHILPLAAKLPLEQTLAFTLESGLTPGPNIICAELKPDTGLIHFTGAYLDGLELMPPLPGPHNARNLVAAVATARLLGLTGDEIEKGLPHFQGAEGRSELRELPGPTPVLCDYYNAQPASVEAAIKLLGDLSRKRGAQPPRAWACLGDMLEMGTSEESLHRSLAQTILAEPIDHVLLYGPRMRSLGDELEKRGFRGQVAHFESHADLAERLTQQAKPGEPILIKGSRGMRMEEIWKKLEPYAKTHWEPTA